SWGRNVPLLAASTAVVTNTASPSTTAFARLFSFICSFFCPVLAGPPWAAGSGWRRRLAFFLQCPAMSYNAPVRVTQKDGVSRLSVFLLAGLDSPGPPNQA